MTRKEKTMSEIRPTLTMLGLILGAAIIGYIVGVVVAIIQNKLEKLFRKKQ